MQYIRFFMFLSMWFFSDLGNAALSGQLVSQLGLLKNLQYLYVMLHDLEITHYFCFSDNCVPVHHMFFSYMSSYRLFLLNFVHSFLCAQKKKKNRLSSWEEGISFSHECLLTVCLARLGSWRVCYMKTIFLHLPQNKHDIY